MRIVIDVYGTLINPIRMSDHLRPLMGGVAGRVAWPIGPDLVASGLEALAQLA